MTSVSLALNTDIFPTTGDLCKFKNVRIFFGSGYFDEFRLSDLGIENYRLKQVHGNRIVSS